ncbi:hypothetical protein MMC10_007882 [Thelotrema lepadinum]|nr:hypothetical protein [Thelotrema lepadinum]
MGVQVRSPLRTKRAKGSKMLRKALNRARRWADRVKTWTKCKRADPLGLKNKGYVELSSDTEPSKDRELEATNHAVCLAAQEKETQSTCNEGDQQKLIEAIKRFAEATDRARIRQQHSEVYAANLGRLRASGQSRFRPLTQKVEGEWQDIAEKLKKERTESMTYLCRKYEGKTVGKSSLTAPSEAPVTPYCDAVDEAALQTGRDAFQIEQAIIEYGDKSANAHGDIMIMRSYKQWLSLASRLADDRDEVQKYLENSAPESQAFAQNTINSINDFASQYFFSFGQRKWGDSQNGFHIEIQYGLHEDDLIQTETIHREKRSRA